MRIKPPLPLINAPDADSRLHEILYYKWCFCSDTSDTVKHENQKDIKFTITDVLLNELYLVAIGCMNLKAKNTVFLFLPG